MTETGDRKKQTVSGLRFPVSILLIRSFSQNLMF